MDFTDAAVNIDGSTDKYARYKMPPLTVTHRSIKGGLTIIENLLDISKAINRDPKMVFAFLQKECSTAGNFKTLSLSGTIAVDKLQTLLMLFIKQHVLCKRCTNPETIYDKISGTCTCKACGFNS